MTLAADRSAHVASTRFDFDVAVSFAGEDRSKVKPIVDELTAAGVHVFYDAHEEASLWGKDLATHLQEVYSQKARYCLIFVSKAYTQKNWTTHELRAALERAVQERGAEYILPVRIDDSAVPGLTSTTAYLRIEQGADHIAAVMLEKLQLPPPPPPPPATGLTKIVAWTLTLLLLTVGALWAVLRMTDSPPAVEALRTAPSVSPSTPRSVAPASPVPTVVQTPTKPTTNSDVTTRTGTSKRHRRDDVSKKAEPKTIPGGTTLITDEVGHVSSQANEESESPAAPSPLPPPTPDIERRLPQYLKEWF